MPIIRKKLFADEVYPSDIRYNPDTGTVQSLVNGDWVDNPLADPRNQTTFPPRATADPACDGAKSVSDALKNQISGVLQAIDDGKTAFTIVGLILGLFSFGLFDIFVAIALAIANAMLDAGTAAINAALTDAVYDTLTCIIFCNMDTSGRLITGGLGAIESEVTTQIGGLGATILNAMLNLAGEGGINNLAAIGTSTGDCSACNCGCPDIPFTIVEGTLVGSGSTSGGHCYVTISSLPHGGGAHEQVDIRFSTSFPGVSTDCAMFISATIVAGTPSFVNYYHSPCPYDGTYPSGVTPGNCYSDIVAEADPGNTFTIKIVFGAC